MKAAAVFGLRIPEARQEGLFRKILNLVRPDEEASISRALQREGYPDLTQSELAIMTGKADLREPFGGIR